MRAGRGGAALPQACFRARKRARLVVLVLLPLLVTTGCLGVRGRQGSRSWWNVGIDIPIGNASRSKGLHCKRDEKIAKVDGEVRCVPKSPARESGEESGSD